MTVPNNPGGTPEGGPSWWEFLATAAGTALGIFMWLSSRF